MAYFCTAELVLIPEYNNTTIGSNLHASEQIPVFLRIIDKKGCPADAF